MVERMKVIVIVGWDELFETGESRKIKGPLKYVCIPTKHDGKTYRKLLRRADADRVYGAWVILLSIAAKCPRRGVLADDSGPLSVEDLSLKTDFPQETLSLAIDTLSSPEIGWLAQVDYSENVTRGGPRISPDIPGDMPDNGEERKGDGRRLNKSPSVSPESVAQPFGGGDGPLSGSVVPGSAGAAKASVFDRLTVEVLRNRDKLRRWFAWQQAAPNVPVFGKEDWNHCEALAEQALGKDKPANWFASRAGRKQSKRTEVRNGQKHG